jgi:hypothetical protein
MPIRVWLYWETSFPITTLIASPHGYWGYWVTAARITGAYLSDILAAGSKGAKAVAVVDVVSRRGWRRALLCCRGWWALLGGRWGPVRLREEE